MPIPTRISAHSQGLLLCASTVLLQDVLSHLSSCLVVVTDEDSFVAPAAKGANRNIDSSGFMVVNFLDLHNRESVFAALHAARLLVPCVILAYPWEIVEAKRWARKGVDKVLPKPLEGRHLELMVAQLTHAGPDANAASTFAALVDTPLTKVVHVPTPAGDGSLPPPPQVVDVQTPQAHELLKPLHDTSEPSWRYLKKSRKQPTSTSLSWMTWT